MCGNCNGNFATNGIELDGGANGTMSLGYQNPACFQCGEWFVASCFATNGGCSFSQDLAAVTIDKMNVVFTIQNTPPFGGRNYSFSAGNYGTSSTTQGLSRNEISELKDIEQYYAFSAQDLYLGRAYFTYNRWQDANTGVFRYQGNDGSGPLGNNPPYSGWEHGIDPLHSTTGGDFYVECDNTACS